MLKVFLSACSISFCVAFCFQSMAQGPARTIQLNADNWIFQPGTVEFLAVAPNIGGVMPQGPAMKITNGYSGAVVAKNIDFSDGSIDFDMQPTDSNFAFFYFHRQDANEAECFYLRTAWGADRPDRMEGAQYNPIIKGIACWNIMPHYQGNATFRMGTWSHIRLIITGRQMLVYVNTDTRPTLVIPRLEGNATHGSFAFEGQMTIANLVVKPTPSTATVWPPGTEGFDPTDNDPRYLRHWQVTQPDTIPQGIDFGKNLLPSKQSIWSPMQAERRGLINLTRQFGGNLKRRIVWLKTTLQADKEWNYKIRLGFTNDVWVFLNGQYLYSDKNYYDEPSMKTPRGRVSIENSSFNLPLKAGPNELLIGVGNDFFGWGIIARLDDTDGVKIE